MEDLDVLGDQPDAAPQGVQPEGAEVGARQPDVEAEEEAGQCRLAAPRPAYHAEAFTWLEPERQASQRLFRVTVGEADFGALDRRRCREEIPGAVGDSASLFEQCGNPADAGQGLLELL